MIRIVPLLAVVLTLSCNKTYYSDEMKISNTLLTKNLQLLEVVTKHVPDIKGVMYLYERNSTEKEFRLIDSFPVTVGRSGFAWDQSSPIKFGFQRIKHEGDGCSPAGIFSLGTIFSYHSMDNLGMPFKQVDESDLCVDDTKSVYYNRLIDTDTVEQKDFDSFEQMKRNDQLYEYGVWVNYNTGNTVAGNGSCIFLHIWKDENTPTSGCTAMSKENMLKLIHWLDAEKNPVLVQYAMI